MNRKKLLIMWFPLNNYVSFDRMNLESLQVQ